MRGKWHKFGLIKIAGRTMGLENISWKNICVNVILGTHSNSPEELVHRVNFPT